MKLNLIQMLGIPDHMVCANCHRDQPTSMLRDYEVSEETNPEPGVWYIHIDCPECKEGGVIILALRQDRVDARKFLALSEILEIEEDISLADALKCRVVNGGLIQVG